jgi:exonuclease I
LELRARRFLACKRGRLRFLQPRAEGEVAVVGRAVEGKEIIPMKKLHFYDALTAGRSSSEGQVLRFESALVTDEGCRQESAHIRLRDDVFIEPAGIEYTELYDHSLDDGISEYDWSRQAEAVFLMPDTMHIGLGSTSGYDDYIRNALYRSLSLYPNTCLPRHTRFLDLATLTRAIFYLRPELMKWDVAPAVKSDGFLRDMLFRMPEFEDGNNAMRLVKIFYHLLSTSKKLLSYAVEHADPDCIKLVLGLDDGALSDMGAVNPCFITHQSITNARHFGLFMPIAVDMSYPDIIYLADLSCDLTELCDPDTPSLDQLVRRRPDQEAAPIVRVNLSRLPFVAPIATVRPEDAKRLSLDMTKVNDNVVLLREADQLVMRLLDDPIIGDTRMPADVDYRMLAGEYHDTDTSLIQRLHTADFSQWLELLPNAHDNRILELGRRLLLRNRPDILTQGELRLWKARIRSQYCGQNVTPDRVDSILKHAEDSVMAAPGMKGPISHQNRLRSLLI